MRALASIKAELQKRQRLFGEHDVNHINQYQKLFKQGKASEPMPHLFLISDEFAELKSEQPEFMKELVSTARIGRSLGIHLILATQKPSGVVDDQIWSNSKFKLALKVQNASGSNEILKTPDAAEITLPGRSYLQVGNNEIYELFQSAWSGADYIPEKEDQAFIDTTIYAINDLGQYDILTEDLSGLGGKEAIEKVPTELDAVIEYVQQYTETEGIEPLPRPWLPPLPERIFAQDLYPVDFKQAWNKPKDSLQATIGLLDQPELQAQNPLTIDLTKDGHIAVFSSPGYGKSTFLQTVVMDLVRQHSPEQLHLYLLDFGTNGLLPLRNLPHVADTIMADEVVKIGKLIRILNGILKERKKKLSEYGVANLAMYEKASGQRLPTIMIVLDNYDSVREASFVDEFEKVMTQVAREGGSVGIHLLISAGRQNVMRTPLLSNIKVRIPLYLIEQTEARAIVGRTDLQIEELVGRGLVYVDQPTVFQTVLPEVGEETLEIIENIQHAAQEMDSYWQGDKPASIPMMPEVLEFDQFKKKKETKELIQQGLLPLGLEFETVLPIAFNVKSHGHLIAVSDRMEGLEHLRKIIARSLALVAEEYQTMLIDSSEQSLAELGSSLNAYISEPEGIEKVKVDFLSEIQYRLENKVTTPKWLIFVANLKDFSERSNLTKSEIEILMGNGIKTGIHFIFASDYAYLGQSYDDVPRYIRSNVVTGLMNMRLSDQDIFKQSYISNEKYPKQYEAYYAQNHQNLKVKLPKS